MRPEVILYFSQEEEVCFGEKVRSELTMGNRKKRGTNSKKNISVLEQYMYNFISIICEHSRYVI